MTSPHIFNTTPQSVGLKRGDYTRIANICRLTPSHVRAVALGLRKGSDSLYRQLAKRGWKNPAASTEQ